MKRFILTAVAASMILASGAALNAQPPAYLPGLPAAPVAGTQTLEEARAVFLHPDIQKDFPRLGTSFKVLAPGTKDYNAFSYVLGVTDRWLVPEKGTSVNPLAGADRFLAQGGYQRMASFDLSVQPGKQKVVLYGTVSRDGTIEEVTSAALQQTDGSWACKVGSLALIEVPTPEALRGAKYGLPIAVYVRSTGVAQLGTAPR